MSKDTPTEASSDSDASPTDESNSTNNDDATGRLEDTFASPDDGEEEGEDLPLPTGDFTDALHGDSTGDEMHPLAEFAADLCDRVDDLMEHGATPDAESVAAEVAEDYDGDDETPEKAVEILENNYRVDGDGEIIGELSGMEKAMASATEDVPPTWETLRHTYALTPQDLPKRVGEKEVKSTGEAKKRARYLAAARLEYDYDWMYVKDENYGLDTFRWFDPETGLYVDNGEDAVLKLLDEHLREFADTREASEVVEKLKVRNKVERDEVNAGDEMKVLVQNGALDLEEWELVEPGADDYFTYQLNARWDPDVDTSEVRGFLESITGAEHHVDILCEMAGDTLSPHYNREWFAALYGSGGNGKSKFFRLVKETLGSGNTAAQKLDQIINGDYALGHIAGGFGTLANLIPEVSMRKIEDADPIKELTGDDSIGMRDIYGDPYEGTNQSKLFIATNEPMMFTERTNAIVRRIKPLELPYEFKFPGDYDEDNPRHKHADPDLQNWLYTDDNRAAFLQLMAEGLQRLRENNGFSYEKSQTELYDEYQQAADPFFSWWSSCLKNERAEWDDGTAIYLENDKIYSMYKSYVESRGRESMKERPFWNEFNAISGLELEKFRPARADGRTRKYLVPTDEGFEHLMTSGLKDFELNSDIEIPDGVRDDGGNTSNSGQNGTTSTSNSVRKAITRTAFNTHREATFGEILSQLPDHDSDEVKQALGAMVVDGAVEKTGDEFALVEGGESQ